MLFNSSSNVSISFPNSIWERSQEILFRVTTWEIEFPNGIPKREFGNEEKPLRLSTLHKVLQKPQKGDQPNHAV